MLFLIVFSLQTTSDRVVGYSSLFRRLMKSDMNFIFKNTKIILLKQCAHAYADIKLQISNKNCQPTMIIFLGNIPFYIRRIYSRHLLLDPMLSAKGRFHCTWIVRLFSHAPLNISLKAYSTITLHSLLMYLDDS